MKSDLQEVLGLLDEVIEHTGAEGVPALAAALSARIAVLTTAMVAEPTRSSAPSGIPDQNLSAAEAAFRLGMSRDWVYRHARKLPFASKIGSRLVFSEKGLERWNRRQRQRTA